MVDEAVAGAVAEAVAEDAPHQLLPEQRGACVWGGGAAGAVSPPAWLWRRHHHRGGAAGCGPTTIKDLPPINDLP